MAVTECNVTETLQVLDPQGTTDTSSGDRPVEDGMTPLINGQTYVDVVFTAPHSNGYNYDELIVVNTVDNPPLGIVANLVSYEDEDGFRVMFNAPPDSDFYTLRWRITV